MTPETRTLNVWYDGELLTYLLSDRRWSHSLHCINVFILTVVCLTEVQTRHYGGGARGRETAGVEALPCRGIRDLLSKFKKRVMNHNKYLANPPWFLIKKVAADCTAHHLKQKKLQLQINLYSRHDKAEFAVGLHLPFKLCLIESFFGWPYLFTYGLWKKH